VFVHHTLVPLSIDWMVRLGSLQFSSPPYGPPGLSIHPPRWEGWVCPFSKGKLGDRSFGMVLQGVSLHHVS